MSALTLEQICDTCCSSVTPQNYHTLAIQLLCSISRQEAVAGEVCYDADPGTGVIVRTAIRLLERGINGEFTGNMRFIDSLTGVVVNPGTIIDCP